MTKDREQLLLELRSVPALRTILEIASLGRAQQQ
jgi:hypothetical protein